MATRYFLTREGRGLHFFWAIGGERSETENQALLLPVEPRFVKLPKLKKPSNINAFRPVITTTRLYLRRAKLYQLMLMMCIECKELIQTHGGRQGVAFWRRGLHHFCFTKPIRYRANVTADLGYCSAQLLIAASSFKPNTSRENRICNCNF